VAFVQSGVRDTAPISLVVWKLVADWLFGILTGLCSRRIWEVDRMTLLVLKVSIGPLVAVLMARGLNLPWGTEIAFIVLAICAGAPLLPKKLVKLGGHPTYIFSLVVATSVLALLNVPLGIVLLSKFTSLEVSVAPSAVAVTLLSAFLLPLGVGMLVRAVLPSVAERIGEPLL
jgi:predicted Na+-dependent transporter